MPPPDLANRRARRLAGWDALVAVALGAALVAIGWTDLRTYRASTRHSVATFGLTDQPGDTRLGDDEFFYKGILVMHLHNVGAVERDGEESFRHALGPTVAIETWSTLALEQVDFVYDNGFAQDLTVAHNGEILEQVHLPPGRVARSYHVKLQPGSNQFTLTFAVYNHHGVEFGGGAMRPLAGACHQLNVHF